MNEVEKLAVEVVATGLGWPEGPTVLPDGRVVIVESYRSQLTAIDHDGTARQFAYVAGAPNACVLGSPTKGRLLAHCRRRRCLAISVIGR